MYKNYLKSIMDIFFGFIIFILLSPILLLLSFFVFFSMGNPIFFKQERIGKNNIPFIMYKFRTMREPKEGENRLLSDADRVTKVGAFLRKTSLDELPEIMNVIKGEMSLVGPRPLLDLHLQLFDEKQLKRHNVKPGMTGLAQVMGRQFLSFTQRTDLDVKYVENLSLWLDIKIIFKTILVVLGAGGIKTGQKFEEVDDVGLKDLIEKKQKESEK
ncbi:sugar transferase [Acinetobacter lwoffii]|uniref:Lipopolysaccharide/colanic/teichoic acid biosynthesis glycosyltransferase n=1 Tax=Acinetobacter lwoffii TaxID=28090 RepID=A0AAW3VHZ8_ACILW|nr:sugar transferase [Acinetobacter lwoffii]MBB6364081.1 lipopolysaccharide/colanic/teichoic acid biosynthesis glycosyltransferase [Acinetobacter lwoffii]